MTTRHAPDPSARAVLLQATADGIATAAAELRTGRLVAFATETVYGLGALAEDDAAVAALYAAKGRPSFNPLILHVADLAAATRIARFSPTALRLAEAFWPGPLTLVAQAREGCGAALARAGLDTVALRVPDHPTARALLAAVGSPVAAPSANPSGKISPTTAEHVLGGLGDRIAAVLDAGPTPIGVESTIVFAPVDGPARLLRPGGVSLERLEAALGASLASDAPATDGPIAPGQLRSHYAPDARMRLAAARPEPREAWLGFGADPAGLGSRPRRNLSPTADLAEAAARLFADLHALDAETPSGGVIAVAQIPETGLGRAINDRLRRAAAPRD